MRIVTHRLSRNKPFHVGSTWRLNVWKEYGKTTRMGNLVQFVQRRISFCDGAGKDPEELRRDNLASCTGGTKRALVKIPH